MKLLPLKKSMLNRKINQLFLLNPSYLFIGGIQDTFRESQKLFLRGVRNFVMTIREKAEMLFYGSLPLS
jgi:hypothetical protein